MNKHFQLRIAHDTSLVKRPRGTGVSLTDGDIIVATIDNRLSKIIVRGISTKTTILLNGDCVAVPKYVEECLVILLLARGRTSGALQDLYVVSVAEDVGFSVVPVKRRVLLLLQTEGVSVTLNVYVSFGGSLLTATGLGSNEEVIAVPKHPHLKDTSPFLTCSVTVNIAQLVKVTFHLDGSRGLSGIISPLNEVREVPLPSLLDASIHILVIRQERKEIATETCTQKCTLLQDTGVVLTGLKDGGFTFISHLVDVREVVIRARC
jgi:hypothetical protein